MRISTFAAGLLLVAVISPAFAQSIPSDVRCLLLSNAFSKQANDEAARQAAIKTMIFYVGRLDGTDAQTMTNAMRNQSTAIDPKTAGPEMTACAARLAHAQQTIQALGKAVAPAK